MQEGEMGSVTLPGLPDNVTIGLEIKHIGSSDAALTDNRELATAEIEGQGTLEGESSAYYYTSAPALTGAEGPNITSINVTVGPGGVTTQYSFRTYTPQYGKFSKLNADRLKKMGKARILLEKQRIRSERGDMIKSTGRLVSKINDIDLLYREVLTLSDIFQ